MAWTTPRTWTVGEMATASLLNAQIRDNLLATMAGLAQAAGDVFYGSAAATLTRLALGSAGRALRVDSTPSAIEWGDQNPLLPWYVSIDPAETPSAETGVWTLDAPATTTFMGGMRYSDAVQNREIAWDLLLSAGTWTFSLLHHRDTTCGIYDVQIDGASVGTIDGYAAAGAYNVYSEITGISVATAGKRRLKLVMSTKNASSSAYEANIQHLAMLRTV